MKKNIQNIVTMCMILIPTNLLMRFIAWTSSTITSPIEVGPLAVYLILCLGLQLIITLAILCDVVKIAIHFMNTIKNKAITILKKDRVK